MSKLKCINRDSRPEFSEDGESMMDGQSLENRNLVKSKYIDAWINENGFIVHQKLNTNREQKYGLGYVILSNTYYLKCIGNIICDDDKVIIFSTGYAANTSISVNMLFSEIGIVDKNGLYTTIIRDLDLTIYPSTDKLNFNPRFPISGTFEYNSSNELIIAFASSGISSKVMNVNYYLDNLPSILIPFQINDIEMFPRTYESNIILGITENGNLPEGTIYITYKYRNLDGTETDYSLIQDHLFIFKDSISANVPFYFAVEGSHLNDSTNKSISITINNADTNYDFLVIGAIVVTGGQTFAYELKQINTAITITTQITTLANAISLDLDEILVKKGRYTGFKKLTQVSKRLYGFGGNKSQIDDYQKFANNIRIGWISKLKNPLYGDSAKIPQNNNIERSFQHREVMAFYINIVFDDGITRAFHIPGRAVTGGDRVASVIPDVLLIDPIAKKFQYEDTCTVTVTNPLGESSGTMGAWENENEQYADNENFDIYDVDGSGEPVQIGTLRGEKVRHHKMPSIAFMKDNLYDSANIGGNHYGGLLIDALGIEVTNVKFPNSIASRVKSWFISYAERNYTNNLVLGQSHTLFTSFYFTLGSTSNGLNVDTNIYGEIGNDTHLVKANIRTYDFNLIKKQPSIPATYIVNELFFAQKGDWLGRVGNGADSPTNRITFQLDTINNIDDIPVVPINPGGLGNDCRYRKIEWLQYVAERVIIPNCDNRNKEQCVQIQLNRDLVVNTFGLNVRLDSDNGADIGLPSRHQRYLTNIMSNTKDCYFDFTKQKLIYIPVQSFSDNLKTYKGDVYLSVYSINSTGWGAVDPADVGDFTGIRCSHRWLAESTVNMEMRNSNPLDVQTKYTPKYPLPFGASNYLNDLNFSNMRLPYDIINDYYENHDFYILEPFDYRIRSQSILPYRVPRSAPITTEGGLSVSNWKTWLVDDYKEINKNKGIIMDIHEDDRDLIIQTRQATFITTGNEQLDVDTANAFIGSGNIFEREPIEILPSKEGTIGTQNSYCNITTKYGLLTIDREQGNIWLVRKGQQPVCISDMGLNQWCKDNMNYIIEREEFEEDNPYNLFGYTAAFDYYNERFIITKKYYQLTAEAIILLDQSNISTDRLRYIDGRFIRYQTGTPLPQVIELGNTNYFTNNSFTFSYTFVGKDKGWASYHDYTPDFIINTRNNLLSFKSKMVNIFGAANWESSYLFKHNNPDNKCIFYNTTKLDIDSPIPDIAIPFYSYCIPVFNKRTKESLHYYNINWIAKVFRNKSFRENETFDTLLAWNDLQATDETVLLPFIFGDDTTNIRNIKQKWNYNKTRDLLRLDIFTNPNPPQPFIKDYRLNIDLVPSPIDTTKEFQTKRIFIEKYLAVKLLYYNENSSNLQNEIQIEDIDCDVKLVPR